MNTSEKLREIRCAFEVLICYSQVQFSLSVQLGFLHTSPPIEPGFVSKQVSPSRHSYPLDPPQLSLHWEIFGVGLGVLVGLGVGVFVLVGIGVFVGPGEGVFVGFVTQRICIGPAN